MLFKIGSKSVQDRGADAGKGNRYTADSQLNGADIGADAGAEAMAGGADSKTGSQMVFDSQKTQQLVIKG